MAAAAAHGSNVGQMLRRGGVGTSTGRPGAMGFSSNRDSLLFRLQASEEAVARTCWDRDLLNAECHCGQVSIDFGEFAAAGFAGKDVGTRRRSVRW